MSHSVSRLLCHHCLAALALVVALIVSASASSSSSSSSPSSSSSSSANSADLFSSRSEANPASLDSLDSLDSRDRAADELRELERLIALQERRLGLLRARSSSADDDQHHDKNSSPAAGVAAAPLRSDDGNAQSPHRRLGSDQQHSDFATAAVSSAPPLPPALSRLVPLGHGRVCADDATVSAALLVPLRPELLRTSARSTSSSSSSSLSSSSSSSKPLTTGVVAVLATVRVDVPTATNADTSSSSSPPSSLSSPTTTDHRYALHFYSPLDGAEVASPLVLTRRVHSLHTSPLPSTVDGDGSSSSSSSADAVLLYALHIDGVHLSWTRIALRAAYSSSAAPPLDVRLVDTLDALAPATIHHDDAAVAASDDTAHVFAAGVYADQSHPTVFSLRASGALRLHDASSGKAHLSRTRVVPAPPCAVAQRGRLLVAASCAHNCTLVDAASRRVLPLMCVHNALATSPPTSLALPVGPASVVFVAHANASIAAFVYNAASKLCALYRDIVAALPEHSSSSSSSSSSAAAAAAHHALTLVAALPRDHLLAVRGTHVSVFSYVHTPSSLVLRLHSEYADVLPARLLLTSGTLVLLVAEREFRAFRLAFAPSTSFSAPSIVKSALQHPLFLGAAALSIVLQLARFVIASRTSERQRQERLARKQQQQQQRNTASTAASRMTLAELTAQRAALSAVATQLANELASLEQHLKSE